jgi:hypothetical protein
VILISPSTPAGLAVSDVSRTDIPPTSTAFILSPIADYLGAGLVIEELKLGRHV